MKKIILYTLSAAVMLLASCQKSYVNNDRANGFLSFGELSIGVDESVVTKADPAGDNYSIVVYDAANSMYYTSASNSGYAYESGVDDATSIKFTSAQAGTDGSATWTPTYTAVPEPASAMLALAGVAMLIRRRK